VKCCTGAIILRDSIVTLGPQGGPENGDGFASIGCSLGTQVLGGSCTNTTNNAVNITLQEAGFNDNAKPGWACAFHNNTTVPVQITATAICLKPAS